MAQRVQSGLLAAMLLIAGGLAAARASDIPSDLAATAAAREREVRLAPAAAQSRRYAALALAWADNNAELSEHFARLAQSTADSPADDLVAALRVAWAVQRNGSHRPALALAKDVIARARVAHNPTILADALALSSLCLSNLCDYPNAVDTIEQALALLERVPDVRVRLLVYNTAGVAYWNAGHLEQAMFFQQECRTRAAAAGDDEYVVLANIGIGNIEATRRDYAAAHAAYAAARAARQRAGDAATLRSDGDLAINEAVVYTDEGKPAAAIPLGRHAVAVHLRTGARHNLANAYKALARALRDTGQLDEALAQMNRGFAVARTLDAPSLIGYFYAETAILYERRGDYRQALELERQASATRLKFINETSRQHVDDLQEKYQTARREREIAELRQTQAEQHAELERRWRERLGLAALLLAVSGATAAIIWRQRLLLRTKQLVLAETVAAKRAAEEADRMKTRLLAVASHDIKAPLATAAHLVADLRENPPRPDEIDELLAHIQAAIWRVLGHARDFLDVAALETGRLQLRRQAVDLASLVERVCAEQSWHAKAKRQHLRIDVASAPAEPIQADPDRIHQVLTNLVDNAIKFSRAGATTHVVVEQRHRLVAVLVKDEGAGLSAESMRGLFQPFATGEARPTAGESSHGYGLSIAMEIARLHGGSILVESWPGKGATFTLELPFTPAAEATEASRSASLGTDVIAVK